jgi:hypothetical protein
VHTAPQPNGNPVCAHLYRAAVEARRRILAGG